jgi:hypothetical protein
MGHHPPGRCVRNAAAAAFCQTAPVTLEDFTRYVAASIAILGAFVVSPQGAAIFSGHLWTPVRKARARLARWLPFFGRSTTVHAGSISSGLNIFGSVRARVRPAWPERPTVKDLGEAVQNWLGRVDGELDALWSALETERTERQQTVQSARAALQASINDLEERMREAEHRTAEHDSRALPVVGLGAVMGTIPGELAALPLWLYVPLLLAAAGSSSVAAVSAWRLRRGNVATA